MSLLRNARHLATEFVSCSRVWYYRLMGVRIGRNCFISVGAHIDISRHSNITIGNNVSISNGCYILAHTAFSRRKETHETKIEDNVVVFVAAVIMPGVTIGKNSIVGAGSVVTADVPPNVAVMGNPARVIQRVEISGDRAVRN